MSGYPALFSFTPGRDIMTQDMTKGKIMPMLIRFTIPLVLGNLFQLTYNAVDSIIAGRFIGKEALAAGDLFGTVESDREQYARVIFDIAAALALGKGVPEDIHLDGGKYYRCPQIALTGEK